MRLWKLCASLLAFAAVYGAIAGPPAAVAPKVEPDYSKVELRGTLGSGSEWAPGLVFKNPPIRPYLTVKIKDAGEWELEMDEAAAEVLGRSIGKQVTITGTLGYKSIRVQTVNGLKVK